MKTVEIIITGKNSGVELGTFLACVDVDGSLTVPYEIIARRCPELNNNILWVDGELLGDPLEDVIDMVVWGEHEALGSVPVRVMRNISARRIPMIGFFSRISAWPTSVQKTAESEG